MDRWICVHCDHRFELERGSPGEERPACPRCGKADGVETLGGGTSGAAESGAGAKRFLPLALLGAALAGALWWWLGGGGAEGPDEVVLARLREKLAVGAMADRAPALARFAWPGPQVERLAEQLEGGDGEAWLQALQRRLAAAREEGLWVAASLHEPAEDALSPAEEIAARLLAPGETKAKPLQLESVELAALAAAVLRARGEPVALAHAWALEGQRQPPDPTGLRGYYGLALGAGRSRWRAAPGAPLQGEAGSSWRALDEAGEAAAVLLAEGAGLLVHRAEPEEAARRARAAEALDPRSAPAKLLLGLAQVQAGDPQAGLRAIEAARRMQQGPAAELLAGTVLLATGDVDGASRAFGKALSAAPGYAEAHALLGAVHLARGEVGEARAEVAEARRLGPQLPSLPMLEAELALRDGELNRAAELAREAVARRPRQWEVRLQAGRIFRMAGDYDAMRREAREALRLVPASRKEMVRQLALRLLGPTAFDETSEEIAEAAEDEARGTEGGDEALALPDPSSVGRLSLQEPGAATAPPLGEPGGLRLGEPEPKLRLRAPGEQLRLKLEP